MLLQNSFSSLVEDVDTDIKEKTTTHIVKPPPIYADAQILDPLIGLVNNTARNRKLQYKAIKTETSQNVNKYSRNL
jgi:hypothetical protein